LLLLLAATCIGVANPVRAEPAGDAESVLVALELPAPVAPAHDHWLSRLVDALESHPVDAHLRVEVRDALLLEQPDPTDMGASDTVLQMQRRALVNGDRYVVFGYITRLAQSYSVDVRVFAADHRNSLAHLVFEGEGPEGVLVAMGEAADGIRDVLTRLGSAPPEGRRVVFARPEFGPEGSTEAVGGLDTVVEVRVEGNRRIEADAIRAVVGTRVGELLRRERIGEDVRKIFELGFFRDVQVVSADSPEGKIVTFVVEENPIIRQVSVSGNESVGSEDIRDQLTLTVGSTIDYPLLFENQARIGAFYKAQGFYLVEVDYTVEELAQDAVAIDFAIEEGDKIRLTEIRFAGNDSIDDDELLDEVETKPWGWTSHVTRFWDRSGVYAEPIFYQDLDRIQRLYMDRGFIRVRISDPQVSYDESGLRVEVWVTEGPQYSVAEVDVIGDESMDRDQLRALVQLSEGEVFNRSTLSEDVERLRAHYADMGFFSAKVQPRTQVDDTELTVTCRFEVEKGGLYFVDRVDVHGNTRTRDQVVRRELGVVEGELYSANALARSRARVQRLGFFEEVEMDAKPLDEENLVQVDVGVVERPTGSFSFGAGFGSTDGFVVNSSVRQDNLFGMGYGLNASVDLGSRNNNMFIRFTDPYFLNSPTSLSGTVHRSEREYIDFDQEVGGFSLHATYPLDEGETRLGGGYGFTDREISEVEEFQASSMLQREEFQGSSSTSMVTLSLVRDTRDDIRFPKEGQVSGMAVEFAGLGGLNQFLRLEGRTTWFFPVKRWLGFESTFVFNSRFGWAIPLNSISDFDLPGCDNPLVCTNPVNTAEARPLTEIDTDLKLPLTERYFLGGLGAFQLRGFKQRSVGPRRSILNRFSVDPANPDNILFVTTNRLANGTCPAGQVCNSLDDDDIDDFEDLDLTDVIGGDKMFLMNFELQFPISEELGLTGLVFFDMGNAFAENEFINPADFRFGTGAGVQWFSPFGPILLQLGFPLDRLDDEDGSVFEFSIGGSQF
jgi:outer membrane protein insertion porin family